MLCLEALGLGTPCCGSSVVKGLISDIPTLWRSLNTLKCNHLMPLHFKGLIFNTSECYRKQR